jgi:hypothetical protein
VGGNIGTDTGADEVNKVTTTGSRPLEPAIGHRSEFEAALEIKHCRMRNVGLRLQRVPDCVMHSNEHFIVILASLTTSAINL